MSNIQNIFRDSAEHFFYSRNIPTNKISVIEDIVDCRTHKKGSHLYDCPQCDYTKTMFNSCGNRHCPQCQNITKEQWVDSRKSELINTPYFHIVFTLPDTLNPLLYANQKLLYNLMFLCVKETLTELALDKKYLGAEIGITAILHTWGQNLSYHPHIHCIVPGGGLTSCGSQFKHSSKKFFIPVKVLSRKFRGKFLMKLQQLFQENALYIPKDLDCDLLIKNTFHLEWFVYCKPPFHSPASVILYLSRYSHKVAISDTRIIKYENDTVTFSYRDYKDGKKKAMTLSSIEFMRRFLLHVLPKRFVKIRYFGILSTRNRKTKLSKCQYLTNINISSIRKRSRKEIMELLFGNKYDCCPSCGTTLNRHFLPYELLLE